MGLMFNSIEKFKGSKISKSLLNSLIELNGKSYFGRDDFHYNVLFVKNVKMDRPCGPHFENEVETIPNEIGRQKRRTTT